MVNERKCAFIDNTGKNVEIFIIFAAPDGYGRMVLMAYSKLFDKFELLLKN